MTYNQLQFWLLFACLIAPYWWLSRPMQNRLLLVGSYIFYGFWDYRFLFLILISTVIDYLGGLGVAGVRLPRRQLASLGGLLVFAALLLTGGFDYRALWLALTAGGELRAALPGELADLQITFAIIGVAFAYGPLLRVLHSLSEQQRRRWFLAISMVSNVAILAFFKYCDFFIDSFSDLLISLGVSDGPMPLLGIVLPAGISFYTFQAMSYTVDIYRGELEPTKRFDDFALFVCFFPHLVAGPIMRAHALLPQVLQQRALKSGDIEEGAVLVLVGLFKKMALSDNMAPIVNAVFYRLAAGDTDGLTSVDILIAIYAFAIQIYGDFSGYSSIARGISKWLGFELVINFRQPYLAVSPSDFWKRWHVSLSSWLRDYLYIPLGGNRRGRSIEYRNLLITMFLGGLWHGASWTFVAWGLYHGAILCGFRLVRFSDPPPSASKLRWLVRVLVMFHLTCFGWLLFRADNFAVVSRALGILVGEFRMSDLAAVPLVMIAFYWGPIFLLELWTKGEESLSRLLRAPVLLQSAIYAYLIVMIFVLRASRAYEFIYFQF